MAAVLTVVMHAWPFTAVVCAKTATIELELTGPAVPADRILYRLENSSEMVTAVRIDEIGAPFAGRNTLILLQLGEWEHISSHIWQTMQTECPTDRSGRLVYRLTMAHGEKRKTCIFTERSSFGTSWYQIPEMIRRQSRVRTGPSSRLDPRLSRAQSGTLFIESVPPALIEIDGISLLRTTPVNNLHIAIGKHAIRLVDPVSGLAQVFEVTVGRGQAVLLNVELN